MNTTASHIHRDWRAGESARAAALDDIDQRLAAVRQCAAWLFAQGIFVHSLDVRVGQAGKPVITVAPSPLLHILFKDDCASGGRARPPGSSFTYVPWVAVRHGCEIHWSEVLQ